MPLLSFQPVKSGSRSRLRRWGLWLAAACWAWSDAAVFARELSDMSLEELLNVEVTSVSRKSEKVAGAAAAVFVITQDDIRRSGVTSIPEALRLAPGLQVARIDSNKWAITSRGFNGRFANKLLVLMDGRSVYTPTFSGVYWEVQDTALDDIDRIEVIRGPGAAMWGSNAVNGVINIITKSAKQTEGGSVTLGTGTYEKRFGSLRYGAKLGEDTSGRAYVKGFHRGEFDAIGRTGSKDGWDTLRGGFRVDRDGYDGEMTTLQGDAYDGTLDQRLILPSLAPPAGMRAAVANTAVSGANLLGRWRKSLGLDSEVSVQAYYDHTYRNDPFLTEERDTFDIDAQHRFRAFDDHDVVWGVSYRGSADRFSYRFPVFFDSSSHYRQLIGAFLQDDITLVPNQLKATLGAKLEHNDYTGFEGQPNARLAWTPNLENTLWAAVSRAVRIPSRAEDAAKFTTFVIPPNSNLTPLPLPYALQAIAQGSKQIAAETLWAYELGYRFMPNDRYSADLTLFYNSYDRLRSNGVPILEVGSGRAIVPFANKLAGNTYGAEVSLDARPWSWVRLQLNYTYLGMDLRAVKGSVDQEGMAIPGANPQQQASLRSAFTVSPSVDFDLWLRYVDSLPTSGFPAPAFARRIPSYLTLDARLAWRPIHDIELSLVGQNLLDPRHPEQQQEIYAPQITEVPRSVYAQLNWRF